MRRPGWLGLRETTESLAQRGIAQGIDALAAEPTDALLPSQQHAFANIDKPRMLPHRYANHRTDLRHSRGDLVDDLDLFAHGQTKRCCDERMQALAGVPGLLAHERDGRRVSLVVRV